MRKEEWLIRIDEDNKRLYASRNTEHLSSYVMTIDDIDFEMSKGKDRKIIEIVGINQECLEYFVDKYGAEYEYIYFHMPKVKNFNSLEKLANLQGVTIIGPTKAVSLWDMSKNKKLWFLHIVDCKSLIYNPTFLNSGSFYRGITLSLLQNRIDLSNEKEILEHAEKLDLDYIDNHLILNGEDVNHLLHQDIISEHSSPISAIVELREIVNKKLRKITEKQSVVCEGRDITTVVFPNAEHKFYLDASSEVRALRRFNQGVSELSLEEIKASIEKRDEIDKNKKVGALKIAEDATYIDTSLLTIDEVCAIILSKIHL